MFKKTIITGLAILFLAMNSNVYAADTEVVLDSNDGTSGFTVKDLSGNTVFRAGGDGNVGIGTTSPDNKLHVVAGDVLIGDSTTGAGGGGIKIMAYDSNTQHSIDSRDGYLRIQTTADDPDIVLMPNGGNVGIGTTTPQQYGQAGITLDVNGGIRSAYGIGVVRNDNYSGLGWTGNNNIDAWNIGNTGDSTRTDIKHNNSAKVSIKSNGNVGIGTTNPSFKLDVNGNLRFYGGGNYSDIRKKNNVQTLTGALEKVSRLRGVTFRWKSTEEGIPEEVAGKKKIGLIAQEVEKVFPEVVLTDEDGYKAVETANLVAVLIEAVKELEAENENTKKDYLSFKAENEQLKETIATLAVRQGFLETLLLDEVSLPKEKLVKFDLEAKNIAMKEQQKMISTLSSKVKELEGQIH